MDSFYVENNSPVTAQLEVSYTLSGTRYQAFHFPLNNKFNQVIKRLFDIILSIIIISLLLSWLIPLFAILIKLDSRGPVFFRQQRNGNGGKIFTCIKFRSMIVNEEADQLPARENDERVTGFGKFLRTHYIDELPQFLNVLLGDMSIIGPRPHMLSDNLKYEKLIHRYSIRHKVKPGITGLAQVRGYSGRVNSFGEIKARVNMDIFYIRNWSPKLDMIILYRTICKSLGI